MSSIARIPSAAQPVSHPTSTTSLLEANFEDLNSRIVKDRVGLPAAFRSGTYPTDEERRRATAAIEASRSALSVVAEPADIAKAVRLLAGGRKVSGNMDPEAMAEAYMFALDGVKKAVLDKAVRMILRRGAPASIAKTFMPSTDDLLEFCDQIERDVRAMVILTERLLALPEERLPEQMTETHCQSMREKIAALGKPRSMPGDEA